MRRYRLPRLRVRGHPPTEPEQCPMCQGSTWQKRVEPVLRAGDRCACDGSRQSPWHVTEARWRREAVRALRTIEPRRRLVLDARASTPRRSSRHTHTGAATLRGRAGTRSLGSGHAVALAGALRPSRAHRRLLGRAARACGLARVHPRDDDGRPRRRRRDRARRGRHLHRDRSRRLSRRRDALRHVDARRVLAPGRRARRSGRPSRRWRRRPTTGAGPSRARPSTSRSGRRRRRSRTSSGGRTGRSGSSRRRARRSTRISRSTRRSSSSSTSTRTGIAR